MKIAFADTPFRLFCLSSFFLFSMLTVNGLSAQESSDKLNVPAVIESVSTFDFIDDKIQALLNETPCAERDVATVAGVLVSIKKRELNQTIFSWALGAVDKNECHRRTQMMELAWDFRRRKKISDLWVVNEQLYWKDTNDGDGVAIVAENLSWTPELEKLIGELKLLHKFVWVSGEVSDEAASEIRNRGITLSANRFSKMRGRQTIGSNFLESSQSPASEPMPMEEIVMPEQEQLVEPVAIEIEQADPLPPPPLADPEPEPVPEPEPKPEPEPAVVAKAQDCWEHPGLGRFIFEKKGKSMEMTHEIPAKGESLHFTLSSIGNRHAWKTNNVEHVFFKEENDVTLLINVHKSNKEIKLSKCDS